MFSQYTSENNQNPICLGQCGRCRDWATGLTNQGSILRKWLIFFFLKTYWPSLGPTYLSIQCVPQLFRRGKAARSVKLATHLHPVSSLSISRSRQHLPQVPSWGGQGQIYLYAGGGNFPYRWRLLTQTQLKLAAVAVLALCQCLVYINVCGPYCLGVVHNSRLSRNPVFPTTRSCPTRPAHSP